MSNILIESEEYLLSTTQGIHEFLEFIAYHYNSSIRLRRFSKLTADDLTWCDVIVSVRGKSALSLSLAKYAKKYGKYHILYMDDDFLSISGNYGRYSMGIFPKRKEILKEIIKRTDLIWVANEKLGKKYVELSTCKKYIKADTCVKDDELQSYADNNTDTINLVMYVNDGSTNDFEEIISPVLEVISKKYKNKLTLTLLTLKPDITKLKDNMKVVLVDHMTYPEFREFMRKGRFDIGLAPLCEKEFSGYKYINKYFEYTFAGIPGIYSNIPLYAGEIKDGINGVLCENTVEGWIAGLERYINSKELRENCVLNAQKSVKDKFSYERVAKDFVDHCPSISNYRAKKKKHLLSFMRIKLEQFIFVMSEMLYYSFLSIKKGGIKLLLLRIVRYFNRVVTSEKMARRGEKNAETKS